MTLWINGDWITGQGASRVKRNPVSGEVLWQGNDADAAQVEQACRAARAAFPRWARLFLFHCPHPGRATSPEGPAPAAAP